MFGLDESVGLLGGEYWRSMKPKTGERAALLLLIAYCIDFAWKLANLGELSNGLKWWMIAMALTVRFAFMGGLLFLFIRLRRIRKSGTNF